ncbi:dihydropteroate synthase [Frigoriflavimonas asaccharolytica]|uniref:Dihydropteroate synthase n=1 Tax=Frigoriflavimonas asaccharolytica TaxID=2735899 RepID=A0A8J8G8D1_9FLAO|nr:dihydropteroate synthase [Frigoriflavimonas asaccharolytica]NRS92570.1 dihydropteroate synthase [Frigoriflavimonas asaccharolytica]
MQNTINIRGKLLNLSTPKVMGILNVTPDSFSDGGKFNNEKNALLQVEKMIAEGADILDVGAQSTKPNAQKISAKEEIVRFGKIISQIKKEFPESIISLDTFYSEVVKFGFDEGIDIVNDISAGQYDENLLKTVAETGLPYILMHSNSAYEIMHEKQIDNDIILEINKFFSAKILELNQFGIVDIIADPGFGFGKTIDQQFQMLDELQHIAFEKLPILVGISRKSFIYKSLGKTPLEIGEETDKLHLKALEKGARILRVHDVKNAKRTIFEYSDNVQDTVL